jgi:dienelactone hydrolase
VAVFTYFDFSESQSMTDMLAVARAVGGGGRYALVGASLGGRLVIEAAARPPAGLAAIVSLSGERMIDSYPDILPQARQVWAPTLYVGAREDPLTDGSRQQRELHQAMRGNPNEIIQLDGIEHGTDLLDRSARRQGRQCADDRVFAIPAALSPIVRLRGLASPPYIWAASHSTTVSLRNSTLSRSSTLS